MSKPVKSRRDQQRRVNGMNDNASQMPKKTPLSTRFTRQIIRVNDQICFAAFQQWQFLQILDPIASTQPTDFTTGVFPDNPYSETIHRRMSDLPKFSLDAEQVALQMGVIAAVEYVLAYIEEVQELRETLYPPEQPFIRDDAEEEQLRRKLVSWNSKQPRIEYFRTLGCFRLLRNHYAHVNEEPNTAFTSYARLHGTQLNSFWDNGITDVKAIDFKMLPSMQLTPKIAFGIMNLLRICIQHIDSMVADTVSTSKAIVWVIERDPKVVNLKIAKRMSKISTRLRMEWNIHLSPPAAEELIEIALNV